jgi:hypothetical protein
MNDSLNHDTVAEMAAVISKHQGEQLDEEEPRRSGISVFITQASFRGRNNPFRNKLGKWSGNLLNVSPPRSRTPHLNGEEWLVLGLEKTCKTKNTRQSMSYSERELSTLPKR